MKTEEGDVVIADGDATGASVCLQNGEENARHSLRFLGKVFTSNNKKFKKDFD